MNRPVPAGARCLTTDEFRERMGGISKKTEQNWRRDGTVPAWAWTRIGGFVYYPEPWLWEFLESRRKPAA